MAFQANILSRASEAGSPKNRPGSDKTRGQGSLKGTNRTFDSPFLLRQGEPGTSQYSKILHLLYFYTFVNARSFWFGRVKNHAAGTDGGS